MDARIRIGELSRRTGVSVPLLRAWEGRYGLLRPERTPGGFRTYGPDDVRRVVAMRDRRREGVPAARAAADALDEVPVAPASRPADRERPTPDAIAMIRGDLQAALDGFDERGAHAALDRLLAAFSLETALAEGVMPYLGALGRRWEAGEVSIAQEHFATTIVRGRLLGLARNWGDGHGPLALLACPPEELHDLGLICFGLALRERGWRIAMLGTNTPIDTVAEAAERLRPEAVVIAAMESDRLEASQDRLARLAASHRVVLAGPGASPEMAQAIGCRAILDDPVRAAMRVGALLSPAGAAGAPA